MALIAGELGMKEGIYNFNRKTGANNTRTQCQDIRVVMPAGHFRAEYPIPS